MSSLEVQLAKVQDDLCEARATADYLHEILSGVMENLRSFAETTARSSCGILRQHYTASDGSILLPMQKTWVERAEQAIASYTPTKRLPEHDKR